VHRLVSVPAALAALELIRLGVVKVFQAAPFSEIHATRTPVAFSAEQVSDTYR
jgi:chromatin segregation and condensation protein Rec8/ScpA/Scc1 (kleisin family)